MQLPLHFSSRERFGPIGRNLDSTAFQVQELHSFVPFSGAKNQADGTFFTLRALVTIQPTEIKFHLPLITRLEVAKLQLHGDQSAKVAVVKQQVKVVIHTVNRDPLLAFEKCKTYAKLQEKRFHLPQDRRFDILFGVRVLQPKKIQKVGITEDKFRGQLIVLPQSFEFLFASWEGFLESAVRSKSMESIFFSSVRLLHFSMRHNSA